MSESGRRESIWSISEDDLKIYSIMFPCIWLAEIGFYLWQVAPWYKGLICVIEKLIMSVGIMGVSAAVLSMMALAGWRGIMVLFDWKTRSKTISERDAEWEKWIADNPIVKKAVDEAKLETPASKNGSRK